jgi:hypothetical protein
MSKENVESVRRFIEAAEKAQGSDDWRPVFAELDPDVEARKAAGPSAQEVHADS